MRIANSEAKKRKINEQGISTDAYYTPIVWLQKFVIQTICWAIDAS